MLAQDRAFHLNLRVDGTDDAEALRRLRELEGIDRMRKLSPVAEVWRRSGWGGAPTTRGGGEGAGSAQQPAAQPSGAMNEALAAYLDYNNRRQHRSLGMKTPAERP